MLTLDPAAVPADLLPVVEVLGGDCSTEQCIIDSDLLTEAGFEVVAPHPYVPSCGSNSSRDWAGRLVSKRRWNVCSSRPAWRYRSERCPAADPGAALAG